jgi:septal ring factor EnvC (AmiA/AmiB activator)
VEPLLEFAAELEQRDALVARALANVESLHAEVEEIRAHTDAVARFLASLPALTAQRDADVRAADAAREEAAAALRAAEQQAADAKKEAARLEAERARASAAGEVQSAERWLAEAQTARDALHRDADARRAEGERLQERAVALAPHVRDVPPPGAGVDGAHEWAAQARGALLLERSNLARERDAVVREASELVASVTGEPLTSTAVAGIRERLALALARPSS